jgi:hypothetical protein
MCEPTICELLIDRVYVQSAIIFYLAFLTYANRRLLNQWYIGHIFEVQSHFIYLVCTVIVYMPLEFVFVSQSSAMRLVP